MDGIMMLFLIEVDFERKDGEHLIDIPFDSPYAPLLPCPYLRRDIVIDPDISLGVEELRYVEVESGIVDKYHDIWFPRYNVVLAEFHIPENLMQVQQYRHKAHVCQVTDVPDACSPDGTHPVAAEISELCYRVDRLQRLHQPRRMEVATRLTGYQVVSHIVL